MISKRNFLLILVLATSLFSLVWRGLYTVSSIDNGGNRLVVEHLHFVLLFLFITFIPIFSLIASRKRSRDSRLQEQRKVNRACNRFPGYMVFMATVLNLIVEIPYVIFFTNPNQLDLIYLSQAVIGIVLFSLCQVGVASCLSISAIMQTKAMRLLYFLPFFFLIFAGAQAAYGASQSTDILLEVINDQIEKNRYLHFDLLPSKWTADLLSSPTGHSELTPTIALVFLTGLNIFFLILRKCFAMSKLISRNPVAEIKDSADDGYFFSNALPSLVASVLLIFFYFTLINTLEFPDPNNERFWVPLVQLANLAICFLYAGLFVHFILAFIRSRKLEESHCWKILNWLPYFVGIFFITVFFCVDFFMFQNSSLGETAKSMLAAYFIGIVNVITYCMATSFEFKKINCISVTKVNRRAGLSFFVYAMIAMIIVGLLTLPTVIELLSVKFKREVLIKPNSLYWISVVLSCVLALSPLIFTFCRRKFSRIR